MESKNSNLQKTGIYFQVVFQISSDIETKNGTSAQNTHWNNKRFFSPATFPKKTQIQQKHLLGP